VEEGREFWGRYPPAFRQGFVDYAVLGPLHKRMLKQMYFPVVGSVPRGFVAKNRRHLDMSVAQFENDSEKKVDRSSWGLPVPNKPAAYISLAKYAKDVKPLTAVQVRAMNMAVEWLEHQFGPHMCNSRVKNLSEVVAGIDKSTSPGFPWTRTYATKRDMIDQMGDAFDQYMMDDWDRLCVHEYTAVFGNSLKEEIRPAEKIEANSIRTFTAGPIEMTIHGNRLFEDMNEKFYASHLKTPSVVGFSVLKGGWNELYRKLKKHPNGFALDESQYDSSLRNYLMWAMAGFRWRMLREEDQTPENLERIRVYYRNLVNTLIITSEGVFVMKQGGNPSGSVNTITDNTLILYTLLAYAWIMVSPEVFNSYEMFESELALALCGDDNTWTVSNEAVQFFNARSVIREWAVLGVTTTTDSLDPRPVEDLDFLSAFTVFIDGVAVPLYKREKLLTSLLYSRDPDNPSFTLLRAAALLRVGYADPQMRSYLRELISWLVYRYGLVLADDPDWKSSLRQVPTDVELRRLFLGVDCVPLINQGFVGVCKDKYPIKSCAQMFAQPQRSRANRGARRAQRNGKPQFAVVQQQPLQRVVVGKRKRNRNRKRNRGRGVPIQIQQPRRMFNAGNTPRRQRAGIASMGNMFPTGRAGRSRRTQTVTEDEYIAEVTSGGGGGATFTTTSYPINPGQAVTFPWLAKEAALFEKYRFSRLEFYFRPEVSAFAGAGQTGKVMLSCDYDASDAPPTTKQQVEDTHPHSDGMPYESFALVLEPRELNPLSDAKYVRPGGLPGATDIKTYDCGNLFVSTIAINGANTVLGELRVRYTVTLDVPVLDSNASAPANNSVAQFNAPAGQALVTTVPTNLAIATVTTNGIGVVNAAGVLTLQPGNYLVDWQIDFYDSVAEALQVGGGLYNVVGAAYVPFEMEQGPVTMTAIDGSLEISGSTFIAVGPVGSLEYALRAVVLTAAAGVVTAFGNIVITAI
jgi:hypothetical protein